VHVASVGGDGRDLAEVFDDSGEHGAKLDRVSALPLKNEL
jgi:hypothetical protein